METTAMALVGVQELARSLTPVRSKGTISKHAKSGKIPVASYDKNGAPLFDLEQVQAAYENAINPLMRRQGEPIEPSEAPLDIEEAYPERRSPRPVSGLQGEVETEKRLKNRRLVRQIGEDEGRLVLRTVVDDEQTTMARRTRDAVTGFLADKASTAYAFAAKPRTEAEWRVWLAERTREAFNHFASTLALEEDDEFDGDNDVDRNPGESQSAAIS